MKKQTGSSRRYFLKNLAASGAAIATGVSAFANEENGLHIRLKRQIVAANDNINIALIGAGGMGTQDTLTALTTPGIKIVAVCDLYDGRLKDARDKWGKDLFTTRHYKEILARK